MRRDPSRRTDNLCALPACRKPLRPVTAAMRKYAGAQIDSDPFCSSNCCREWHGNPLPTQSIWRAHHGTAPPVRVSKHQTVTRSAYRARHKVPCENCGTLVEGKGRGGDPDRPYLCVSCWHARRETQDAAA